MRFAGSWIGGLLLVAGCRERAIVADAAPAQTSIDISIDATSGEPVIYVDLTGRVRTARGVASVPLASRHAVAVEGPDGVGGAVWIADVWAEAASWPARRASRAELERRGLIALPPGLASRITLPPADDVPVPRTGDVVVYGASWCGACNDARAWLDARHVVYAYRDVEQVDHDPAAAMDAARLCAALGAHADRVPVIDVAGRVIVGFDPVRLTTILGEPI